ncbi:MAG: methyltransferase domain-containing protein [Saprospiraceae bacterium]|nr:methyltransferase domain-containing protein [Saprospiraceae bacterium]
MVRKEFLNNSSNIEKAKVLDVGSYDVNGSYKHLFPIDKFDYKGLDMAEGPNVDIFIENPYIWKNLETDSFDVVISGQAFEHIEFFWLTLAEMTRVLKKGGLLCIIAPNGFGEHRFPVDCYRFFTDGMISLARFVNLEPLHAHTNLAPTKDSDEWFSDTCADSMLIARKNYSGNTQYVDLTKYVCIPPNHKILNYPLVEQQQHPKNYSKKHLEIRFRKALQKLNFR